MKPMKWKERSRAAAWHLLASLAVASLAAALVFLVWYPYPYGEVAGGSGLFRIIVAVDVIMGPLLTFVVFNSTKPRTELWRDLSVVVALQLSALIYGLYTVYQARPVYLVHEVDRFRVVTAADIDPADLPQAQGAFRELPNFGIRVIGLRPPKDADERMELLGSALAGKDISLVPKLWQDLDAANRQEIRTRAKEAAFLRPRSKDGGQALDRLLAAAGVTAEQALTLPLVGRRDDWSVVMDKRELRIIGYLPVDGF